MRETFVLFISLKTTIEELSRNTKAHQSLSYDTM